jgi:hypothetical protein
MCMLPCPGRVGLLRGAVRDRHSSGAPAVPVVLGSFPVRWLGTHVVGSPCAAPLLRAHPGVPASCYCVIVCCPWCARLVVRKNRSDLDGFRVKAEVLATHTPWAREDVSGFGTSVGTNAGTATPPSAASGPRAGLGAGSISGSGGNLSSGSAARHHLLGLTSYNAIGVGRGSPLVAGRFASTVLAPSSGGPDGSSHVQGGRTNLRQDTPPRVARPARSLKSHADLPLPDGHWARGSASVMADASHPGGTLPRNTPSLRDTVTDGAAPAVAAEPGPVTVDSDAVGGPSVTRVFSNPLRQASVAQLQITRDGGC